MRASARAVWARCGAPTIRRSAARSRSRCSAALRADEDRLRRFEQEARTVGGLNHPNLLILHDVGRHDGAPYLVTELLEGESLRARLSRGRLPVKEAVRIAAEVARGLAAAHGAGVVHRDIKPDNVFVAVDGRVKILDFGVAKLRRSEDEDPARGSTLAATPETAAGAVVGTPGYMAPEQLGAGTVDARTDVFALGIVLHEMIAGARPFAADSGVEESYAILKGTPAPLDNAPPEVERIVARCLEKRPEARFQSAADLAFALETPSTVTGARVRTPPKRSRRIPWLAIACAVLAVALAITTIGWQRARGDTKVVTVSAPPPATTATYQFRRATFDGHAQRGRFSADQHAIIFTELDDDQRISVVRAELDRPSFQPLGIADARVEDVSSRGELLLIGDMQAGPLERLAPGTGGATVVAQKTWAAGWGPGGDAIAAVIVDRDGAHVEYPLGTTIRSGSAFGAIAVSRDGAHVALTENATFSDSLGRVVVVDREGHDVASTPQYPGLAGIVWSPDGSEVWFSTQSKDPAQNGVFALDLAGHVRRVLLVPEDWYLCDVASDGRLILTSRALRVPMFSSVRGGPAREITWLDGSAVQSMSRDGHAIAFIEALGTGQTDDGYAAYLRTDDELPVLIGHGFELALFADASALIEVQGSDRPLVRQPIGGGAATSLPRGAVERFDISELVSISDDGRRIAFIGAAHGAPMALWTQALDGGDPVQLAPADTSSPRHPLSPDGAWIAVSRKPGGIRLLSTLGKPSRDLAAATPESPVSFSGDGTAVFAVDPVTPAQVERIDLATGKRSPWLTITRPAQASERWFWIALDGDGKRYAVSFVTSHGELYVAEPVQGTP